MRVEKLALNKVRILISYEDLAARGIDRDEMWQNGKKVQELFWDMMEVAYTEVGFEIVGPFAVEAFTMPTEGVMVVVTQVPQIAGAQAEGALLAEEERDPFAAFVFAFDDFEHLVQASQQIRALGDFTGSLYAYNGSYHVCFDEEEMDEAQYECVWSILSEYGEPASVTRAMLDEYGKLITDGRVLAVIAHYFGS
jgi:adapter protein MecA 1/2